MSGNKTTITRNLLEIILGILIFIALVVAFIALLAAEWGPEGPNMDRTFRAFLPYLIVGACTTIALVIGFKIWKKQQKK